MSTMFLEERKEAEKREEQDCKDYYNAISILHPDLRPLFWYDGKVYRRKMKSELKTKNMGTEFFWVIKTQFGEFLDEDWDIWNTGNGMDEEGDQFYGEDFSTENKCICTHKIFNLFYITHLPTKMTFQVGCDCVLKEGGKLADKMKIEIKRKANWKKGNICTYCSDPLTDMRKTYQRDGYCDIKCDHKFRYLMPFGKFKKQRLVEFMVTDRGKQYINEFVKPTIEFDKNAFYRYPLFLEIVNETDLE